MNFIKNIAMIVFVACAGINFPTQAGRHEDRTTAKCKRQQTHDERRLASARASFQAAHPDGASRVVVKKNSGLWARLSPAQKVLLVTTGCLIVAGMIYYFSAMNQQEDKPSLSCVPFVKPLLLGTSPARRDVSLRGAAKEKSRRFPKEYCSCVHPVQVTYDSTILVHDRDMVRDLPRCHAATARIESQILPRAKFAVSLDDIKAIHCDLVGGKSRGGMENTDLRTDDLIVWHEDLGGNGQSIEDYIAKKLSFREDLDTWSNIMRKVQEIYHGDFPAFIARKIFTKAEQLVFDKLFYLPPQGKDILPLMLEFVKKLNDKFAEEKTAPMTVAAYAHDRLVKIHPFADGNGRTARMIMNMCLMHYGFDPITVINERKYMRAVEAGPEAFEAYLRNLVSGESQEYMPEDLVPA